MTRGRGVGSDRAESLGGGSEEKSARVSDVTLRTTWDDEGAIARLGELANRVWAATDLHLGLAAILDVAIELAHASKGTIQLLDPESQTLHVAVQHGFSEAFLSTFARIDAWDASTCGRALRTGQRVASEDIANDPWLAPHRALLKAEGCRSAESTPLVGWDGATIGMLSTYASMPYRPTPAHVRQMDLLAHLASAFVARFEHDRDLRRRERQLRYTLDAAAAGMWWAPVEGGDLGLDARASSLLGLPSLPAVAVDTFLGAVHPDDRASVGERIGALFAGTRDTVAVEIHVGGAQGPERWVRWMGGAVNDATGRKITGIVLDISERMRAEQALLRGHLELEARATQLRRLASELTLSEQRTRREIALVLHDQVQQALVAAVLRLDLAAQQLAHGQPVTAGMVETLQGYVAEAIVATRTLASELQPTMLQTLGLGPALSWLAELFQRRYGLTVETRIDPSLTAGGEDVRALLFESVRELLFNVVKHARIDHARLAWTSDAEGNTCIEVADDGVGFDPVAPTAHGVPSSNGLGLFAVRERLELLGARLRIHSVRGKGTRVTIEVPARHEATSAGSS